MLELKNVSGGYGKRTIVSGVSAELAGGEITSIIGANGCGKSTLLMMCAGLLSVSSGAVLLGGEDISALPRNALAKRISYLGQIKNAGSISVRSLVSHGRFPYLGYPRRYSPEDQDKISEAMQLAGVEDISDRMVSELSGGQQQRAYIAMMLAQDTDVVLLDEPLTYLDIIHQLGLMELAVKLKSMGKAIIMVMHDLNLALTYSDRIAVMKDGRLIGFDTPENIAAGETLQSALGVKAAYCADAGQYFFSMNTD
ncbi:MAG: ABC transporter ATP-binding protein [Ruminococcus sp.]|nr:ABC transporter ATP-binding protein [Ruminococcus sp.]